MTGWWFQPEKYERQLDDYSKWKKKKYVPNHQPDI